MRIIKQCVDNLEEMTNFSQSSDSYAPSMGDFILDTSTYLDAKIEMMLIKKQRTFKTYLEKSAGRIPVHKSQDNCENFN
jgi:hypothetical protein